MRQEKYFGVTQEEINEGLIKVGIPCPDDCGPSMEWCWARRMSPSYARLENCCTFADGVSFGDIVEFCEQDDSDGGPHEFLKSFVRVVTRGSTQHVVAYATIDESRDKSDRSREIITQRYRELRRYCDAMPNSVRPIAVEGMVPGLACVAFPAHVTDDEAETLIADYQHLVDDE